MHIAPRVSVHVHTAANYFSTLINKYYNDYASTSYIWIVAYAAEHYNYIL